MSAEAVIVPLRQSDNDPEELLTLKDLATRLGVTYGRLRGLAEAEGVAAYVGALDVAGVKGVRYPPEAEACFRRLLDAQDAGLVTPKTISAWLSRAEPAGSSSEALVPMAPAPVAQVETREMVEVLSGIAALLQSHIAPPEDRLIGAEEAAELLACRPRSVSRYVKPVRPGVWKRSQVLRYIAAL